MQKIVCILNILLIPLLLTLGPRAAWATNYLDVSTALKTLLVVTDKMEPPIIVGIVYDGANSASQGDAAAIKSMIDKPRFAERSSAFSYAKLI
jgi:hypothetical protein